ncbi:MAG: ACP S-malonyltransferase [Cyanobacteriota bacterium]|nr:ACP S-malonyltransferase [Cyanobacteriota bacterium]
MTKTAWVFPGQGSQATGMGTDLLEIPTARTQFDRAEEILGWSVSQICQEGGDSLSRTLYTQPSLYVVETVLVDLLREKGRSPDIVAGHSLGEYVALYAAGAIDFETGLRLVKRRAELMDTAAGGEMAALMKFDRDRLSEVIQETEGVVLANDNSAAQVVISGTPAAVDTVLANVKAKRAVKLDVSGAFHSPLMAPAALEFQQILNPISFSDTKIPVLSNVDPTPTTDGNLLKDRLMRQMTGSVRWREICLQLNESGIEAAIEVGPGKVLAGLLKRTCSGMTLENVSGAADLPT